MLKFKDRFKSFVYRLLSSKAANGFNYCANCKERRKNWIDFTPKENFLIGYDKVLGEWVAFSEYNAYVKIWAMNGYVVKIFTLHDKLWNQLKPLCNKCITGVMKDYVEPEDGVNEAG